MFHYNFEVAFEGALEQSRKSIEKRPVDDRWRGWNYNRDEFQPPHNEPKLPMYIIANKYCSTSRDVYLEKVRGVKGKLTKARVIGHLYHLLVHALIAKSRRYLLKEDIVGVHDIYNHLKEEGNGIVDNIVDHSKRVARALRNDELSQARVIEIKEDMKKLWAYEIFLVSAYIFFCLSRHPDTNIDTLFSKSIPFLSERQVNGSKLWLSERLSVDVITIMGKKVVIDIKTGERKEFHKLTTTGYALAWESEMREGVDIGCIVYIEPLSRKPFPSIRCEFHPITESDRSWFIEERNEKMRIIAEKKDPRIPDQCPENCPFFDSCHPGRS